MIPFANPHATYRHRKKDIFAAIERSFDSGWYILGEEVERFETLFASYVGVDHAVGCGNGTDALELALRAANVGSSDAVFTVSHTAVATVSAIERCGAVPVLVDVDNNSMTMDPESLERTLEHIVTTRPDLQPKAVIPVHLYGHMCDMSAVRALAEKFGLFVLEDCAQAHGAKYKGSTAGTMGDAAAFSFYPTKNLGALGDGGASVCNDQSLADTLRALRQYGWRQRYISDCSGINSRLDPVQAAILQVQLAYLDEDNARRRKIAAIYDAKLPKDALMIPKVSTDVLHVYHLYVVRTPKRDSLHQFLKDRGVGSAVHYPLPVHLQPAYIDKVLLDPCGLHVTERISGEVLSLPMFPQLSDEDAISVCNAVADWVTSL